MTAEEYIKNEWGENWLKCQWEAGDVIDALKQYAESYHKERVNRVTDEEIEKWADDIADPESKKDFERGEWLGFKEGASKIKSKLMEE